MSQQQRAFRAIAVDSSYLADTDDGKAFRIVLTNQPQPNPSYGKRITVLRSYITFNYQFTPGGNSSKDSVICNGKAFIRDDTHNNTVTFEILSQDTVDGYRLFPAPKIEGPTTYYEGPVYIFEGESIIVKTTYNEQDVRVLLYNIHVST